MRWYFIYIRTYLHRFGHFLKIICVIKKKTWVQDWLWSGVPMMCDVCVTFLSWQNETIIPLCLCVWVSVWVWVCEWVLVSMPTRKTGSVFIPASVSKLTRIYQLRGFSVFGPTSFRARCFNCMRIRILYSVTYFRMPSHYSKIKVKAYVVLLGQTFKRNVSTPLVAAKPESWKAAALTWA